SLQLQIGQRAESVWIESVRGMMRQRQANDLSVKGVDVGQLAFHAARMRDREFSVHRRVEVLLGEQTPTGDDAVVLLPGYLRAPGPVVESFISTEEERGDGAAEPEWIAPIVGGNEPTIGADDDLVSNVGSLERQLYLLSAIDAPESK